MDRIRQVFSELTATLARLSPRERRLVAIAGSAALVFLIFVSTLSINKMISNRESRIAGKRKNLEEIGKLTGGYKAAEAQRTELERKLKTSQVRLFTYLDELAKENSLQINGMTDKEPAPLSENSKITASSVELALTRISITKLAKFLTQIESDQGLIKITRLQTWPGSEPATLNASLTVTTYALAEGSEK